MALFEGGKFCTYKCTYALFICVYIWPENAVLYMQMYMHTVHLCVHWARKRDLLPNRHDLIALIKFVKLIISFILTLCTPAHIIAFRKLIKLRRTGPSCPLGHELYRS